MAEGQDKKDDEKLEFDSTGQAVAYISLDQARVLAMRHARENTGFYGEVYGQQELAWEELSADEGEDYYRVRVSYRPIRGFSGRPGVEIFTIDKAGPIESRQMLQEPRPRPRFLLPGIAAGVLALVVVVLAVSLLATGVFSSSPSGPTETASTFTSVTSTLSPLAATELVSPSRDATISVPSGAVDGEHSLTYRQLTPSDLPELPDGFTATGRAFDLSIFGEGAEEIAGFSFRRPITITMTLTTSEVVLADNDQSRLVIQHHRGGSGWESLPTTADFKGMLVTAQVETLSPFALTIREPEPTQTPLRASTPVPDSPTSTPLPTGPDVSVIVISTDLAVGVNRVVFGLVDRDGIPVRATGGRADVQAAIFISGQEATEVRDSATAQFMRWPTGSQGVFSTNLNLDTAGFWQLEVSVASDENGMVEAVGAFQVKEKSNTPSIGDPAPASVTPTQADVEDLATITSSSVPDPDLYSLSVHQALAAGKPLVVVFATPAFCVTATCGPQVQVVSQVKERFQDQANFIHVEVFENPHLIEGGRPGGGFVPAVEEWKLPTEPWTFVVDRAGRVQAKFEAFTTEEELEEALEEVLRSQS